MRETRFINDNKHKWYEFEQILKHKQNDPDKISKLFVEVTEDLSYARSQYPNRSVRVYLNNLAQKAFNKVYKVKIHGKGNFWKFWSDELPFVIYQSRRNLLISFLVFTFSILIGIFSSHHDPDFVRIILGDSYVEMTKANIEKGDPMAVYKSSSRSDMMFGITFNNIGVAFRAFIFGITLGLGTYYLLIFNGIMLGAFQYFFRDSGYFFDSFVTIWQHGTIEISSIIIAGAAGITLGRGLLFPGTYSRIQSFQINGIRAMKIFLGTVPLFIIAGFIESYITRLTDAPLFLRLSVIILSLAFILFYFVWLPFRKAKYGFKYEYEDERVVPDIKLEVRKGIVYSNADIIRRGFNILKENSKIIFRYAFIAAAFLAFIFLALYRNDFHPLLDFKTQVEMGSSFVTAFVGGLIYIADIYALIDYRNYPILFPVNTVMFSIAVVIIMRIISRQPLNEVLKSGVQQYTSTFFVVMFAQLPFFLHPVLAIIISLLITPILVFFIIHIYFRSQNGKMLAGAFDKLKTGYGKMIGLNLASVFISIVMVFVFASSFLLLYFQFVSTNIPPTEEAQNAAYTIYLTATGSFALFVLFPLIYSILSVKFFSVDELHSAEYLKEEIDKIGEGNFIYGLKRE